MKNKGMQLCAMFTAMLIMMATIAVPVAMAESSNTNIAVSSSSCGCNGTASNQTELIIRNIYYLDDNGKVLDIQPANNSKAPCIGNLINNTEIKIISTDLVNNTILANINGTEGKVSWSVIDLGEKNGINLSKIRYVTQSNNVTNEIEKLTFSKYNLNEDYNISINTVVFADESGNYKRFITTAKYTPKNKEIVPIGDRFEIEGNISLSQHYEIMAKQLEKLSGKYPDTKAAYKALAKESNKMSKTIERDFTEYNKVAEKGASILVADPGWLTCVGACGACIITSAALIACCAYTAGIGCAECIAFILGVSGVGGWALMLVAEVVGCVTCCCCVGVQNCCDLI